ncbi:MAG: acyl-CoA thioesterase [Pseudonocardiaceae bacterium]
MLPAYATEIAVRWSDMDSFGHVNNACTVTLIEEARTELLFATARTQLAPYDTARGRPRRLTDAEREFLAGYHKGQRSGTDA